MLILLLAVSLAVLARSLTLMRYQNRTRLIAIAAKAILNTLSVILVVAQAPELYSLPDPWHALRVLPLFANPIALVLIFRRRETSPYLLKTTIAVVAATTLLTATYIFGRLNLVPAPEWLNAWFPIDPIERFGLMSVFYLAFTLVVLTALILPRFSQGPLPLSRTWERYYLANGILRGIILITIILALPERTPRFDTFVGISMTLSVLLDSLILFRYGTNRAVLFEAEHHLPLVAPWNPDIERLVQLLAKPETYTNSRYSLLDAGGTLGWSSTKVAQTLHRDLGRTFKQVLTAHRQAHFERLTALNPQATKRELLKQSGFASYASFHYAERRSK
jgi:AraC-like DNA-binding protein